MTHPRRAHLFDVAVLLVVSGCSSGPTDQNVQGPPSQLAFQVQPASARAGDALTPAVAVVVQDAEGHTVTTATNTIALALGANSPGATLQGGGPIAAINGVATFPGVIVDRPGTGYTLTATSAGLAGGASAAFDVALVFASLASGAFHTCGLSTAGLGYCWGDNVLGALGDSTTTNRTSPTPVSSGLQFAAVSAGRDFTCALTTGHASWCWGYNLYGQLGNGTLARSLTPVPVSATIAFTLLSAGAAHTCAIATASATYCWGYLSLVNSVPSPTPISGGPVFSIVTAGWIHTCGLTASGAAYCWGYNGEGENGDGTLDTQSDTPVSVAGGHVFTQLSHGYDYVCGLTTGGAVYCWGNNIYGQLGDGTQNRRTTPVAVTGPAFAKVAAGSFGGHTCALTTGGIAYCWGGNGNGQLGDGTTTQRATPVAVSGGLTFASISVGGQHTCGVTTNGVAYCWGSNSDGQLGTGASGGISTAPVRVAQ